MGFVSGGQLGYVSFPLTASRVTLASNAGPCFLWLVMFHCSATSAAVSSLGAEPSLSHLSELLEPPQVYRLQLVQTP